MEYYNLHLFLLILNALFALVCRLYKNNFMITVCLLNCLVNAILALEKLK